MIIETGQVENDYLAIVQPTTFRKEKKNELKDSSNQPSGHNQLTIQPLPSAAYQKERLALWYKLLRVVGDNR